MARELNQLWCAVFGQPPAIKAGPEVLADVLVKCLPPAPAYRPGLIRKTSPVTQDEAVPSDERRQDRGAKSG